MDSTLTNYKDVKALRILLTAGGDLHTKVTQNSDSDSDVDRMYGDQSLFDKAINSDNVEVLKLLIDMDRSLLDYRSESGKTLLILAAEISRVKIVKFLLSIDRENVMNGRPTMLNVQNIHGWTALSEVALNESPSRGKDIGENSYRVARLLLKSDFFYSSLKDLLPDYKSIVLMQNKWQQTPLICAAGEGNFSVIKLLLDADSSALIMKDHHGDVPLVACVGFERSRLIPTLLDYTTADMKWTIDEALDRSFEFGHLKNAELLLKAGGKPKHISEQKFESGRTNPYEEMMVSMANDAKIVRRFLEAGVDPNAKDTSGCTALINASLNDNAESVSLLLEAGANPNLKYKGETALMKACGSAIIKMLIDKSSLNMKNSKGMTALNIFTDRGYLTGVRLLVDAGASMSEKNNDDETPLMTAIMTKYADDDIPNIVRCLLEKDQSNIKLGRRSMMNSDALHTMVKFHKHKLIRVFLETIKDNTFLNHSDTEGQTALIKAIYLDDDKIVEAFVELADEAVLTAIDHDNNNALAHAVEVESVECVRALLKADRKVLDIMFRNTDNYNWTVLMIAVHHDIVDILKMLLDAKPPLDMINFKDYLGQSLLDYATGKRKDEMVDLLRAAGMKW